MTIVRGNRDLNALHPKVKKLAEELIKRCKEEGINVGISETYRTVERQDYLYAKGRTIPGNIVTYAKGSQMASYHQWGLAFDVFNNERGNAYNLAILDRIGEIGESIGLEWGGRWKNFKDRPHFQYTEGLKISDLRAGRKIKDDKESKIIEEKEAFNYEDAIDILSEKGIINTYEAWYPEPSERYFEQLIRNMMPHIMNEVSYEYHIKILNLLGIINSPDIWLRKEFEEVYMKTVIMRITALMKEE